MTCHAMKNTQKKGKKKKNVEKIKKIKEKAPKMEKNIHEVFKKL